MERQQISVVTAQGITYIDYDDREKFVDFTECYNTYLKRELSRPTITKLQAERARQNKQVGEVSFIWSDGEDDHPAGNFLSVTFYDNRVTSFEFSDDAECRKFEQSIVDAGWTLYDRTD